MKHTLIILFLLTSLLASAQTYQQKLAFTIPNDSLGIDLQFLPDGSNRLVVVQQLGRVYIFDNKPNPTYKMFLNLRNVVSQSGGELGLLGLAFHPNFSQNGYFFVNYTKNVASRWRSCISRFQVSGPNNDTVLLSSEKVILEVYQPYSNHNGGWIGFGPDGFLYTSLGDGGASGDPQNRSQNKDSLLGKILRINIDSGDPYAIPSTNPFASGGGKPEIYAYGLRNAWRCSFDRVTNKLWAGDVGQNVYEEVDTIINGGNYGWRVKEGYHCFIPSTNCDSTGFQSPIWEYSHSVGYSVTGGHVYRGPAAPGLTGKYVYADLNGKVWALTYEGLALPENTLLFNLGSQISSFGVDQNNELYIVSWNRTNLRIFSIQQIGGSVGDNNNKLLPRVYPNPANDKIRVEVLHSGNVNVQLVDLNGKVVLQDDRMVPDPTYSIDVSGLVPGTYTLIVTDDSGSRSEKFVIAR